MAPQAQSPPYSCAHGCLPPPVPLLPLFPGLRSLSDQPLSEEDEHGGTNGDVETAQTTRSNPEL